MIRLYIISIALFWVPLRPTPSSLSVRKSLITKELQHPIPHGTTAVPLTLPSIETSTSWADLVIDWDAAAPPNHRCVQLGDAPVTHTYAGDA